MFKLEVVTGLILRRQRILSFIQHWEVLVRRYTKRMKWIAGGRAIVLVGHLWHQSEVVGDEDVILIAVKTHDNSWLIVDTAWHASFITCWIGRRCIRSGAHLWLAVARWLWSLWKNEICWLHQYNCPLNTSMRSLHKDNYSKTRLFSVPISVSPRISKQTVGHDVRKGSLFLFRHLTIIDYRSSMAAIDEYTIGA